MSKANRSLRFQSPDDMSPGMRKLYQAYQTSQDAEAMARAAHGGVTVPRAAGKTTMADVVTLAHAVALGEQEISHQFDPRRSKYGAVVTYVDGIRFDSKREAAYYSELKLRQAAGEIRFFLRQVPFHLPGGTKLVVDFEVHEADGRVRYIDVKGRETPVFRLKKREVEHHYPVEIELA